MSRYDRQLQAAQAALDNACDCCDHGPREPAPVIERAPYADANLEFGGVEPGGWRHAIALSGELNARFHASLEPGEEVRPC